MSVYKKPNPRKHGWVAILLAIPMGLAIFIAVALMQIIATQQKPQQAVELADFTLPPPDPPFEEDEPPPEPEDPPDPPEPEPEPPNLTLEQLDLALNPGMGGQWGGDFRLPTVDTSAQGLGTLDVFDLKDLDTKPRPTKRVSPVYPKSLQKAGISGRVILLFIVDANGKVANLKVESSTNSGFNQAAIDAVKKWIFEPGIKDNRKVKTRVRLPMPFLIN